MTLNNAQKIKVFTNLIRADHFDKAFYRRMLQGKLIGFYHPGEGAIAPGVGAASFLNDSDNLSPHHRAHGMAHMLSKGVELKYYLAEHTGKETGCCQGRSAFHFCFPEKKLYMQSGFIGYNFAPAVGWGFAAKKRGKNEVVMNCSGDGSYGQGRAHESMLLAKTMNLPIIFWCENNGMAIHATIEEMHPTKDISSLASGFDMPAMIVDGQDVFACAEVALKAIQHARSGKGPIFVECKTMRFKEHDMGTKDLKGFTPRENEELEAMKAKDPVVLASKYVLDNDLLTQQEINEIIALAEQEVLAAEKFADGCAIATPTQAQLQAEVYAP